MREDRGSNLGGDQEGTEVRTMGRPRKQLRVGPRGDKGEGLGKTKGD